MKNKRDPKKQPWRTVRTVNSVRVESDLPSRYEVVRLSITLDLAPAEDDDGLFGGSVSIRDHQNDAAHFDLPMVVGLAVVGNMIRGDTEPLETDELLAIAVEVQEQDGLSLSETDALSLFRQLLAPMHSLGFRADIIHNHIKRGLSKPRALLYASSRDDGQPLRWVFAGADLMTKE